MKLVVETGAGLPDANSYVSLNDAMKNLPSLAKEEWKGMLKNERIDRLVIASQFIDVSFIWAGQQKTFEQGLSWPRVCVYFEGHSVPDNIVPRQVKRAVIMALLMIFEHGISVFQSNAELLVKKEKLGPIETEYFSPGVHYYEFKSQYEDINNMLHGFYSAPSGGNVIAVDVKRI